MTSVRKSDPCWGIAILFFSGLLLCQCAQESDNVGSVIRFQDIVELARADTDRDGLFDDEEEDCGADPTLPDTDSDEYSNV